MDPASALDRESEHWLHMRFLERNAAVSTVVVGSFTGQDWAGSVDIRVMRKVQEGDGIKLVVNCATAYVSMANLRLLLKHT